jgi:AcrR family transcriptional regulator
MATGGRSSLSASGRRTKRAEPRKSPTHIAPLYKRLPHGPHRLARNEVVLHQRARIHGSMLEAVGRAGYEGTSVRQVIGLAGVSRRSFYEQFANKEECFLATFDLILRRDLRAVTDTYREAEGTMPARARASFRRLAQMLCEDRNASVLVLIESQRVGPAGVGRLRRALTVGEQLLAQSFAESSAAAPLPKPIVRGIAGGVHGATSAFLRAEAPETAEAFADELLDWTLRFATPAGESVERLDRALALRMREVAAVYGGGLSGAEAHSRDERTRLLQGVLRLATQEDYRALTGPQIADEANVSIDAFCEAFDGRDECFLSALDMISDELLAIAADAELVSEDWPRAVRRVVAQLMWFLADNPLYARTLVQEGCFAGDDAFEHTVELSRAIATLLTEGAPGHSDGELATEAIAGALWHTIRCQVATGATQMLAALSDHLTYLVLTPFVGADAAVEIVSEPRPASWASCDAFAAGARQST